MCDNMKYGNCVCDADVDDNYDGNDDDDYDVDDDDDDNNYDGDDDDDDNDGECQKYSASPVALIRFSKLKKSAKGSEATRPMNSRGFVMKMMILLLHNPL